MQNVKKNLLGCPDSYQNSKADISDCKTNAIYAIPSYLCLKTKFREAK